MISTILQIAFCGVLVGYGIFGMYYPETIMGFRGERGKDSWLTGGALYKTPARARAMCAVIAMLGLIGAVALINDPFLRSAQ